MIRKTIIYIIVFILFYSCRPKTFIGIEGEGIIEYDITYLKNELKEIPDHLLPRKMIMVFSPRYTKSTIEGFAGIFSIKNVNDLKEDTVTTILKYFNYKYYYTSKPKEQPCCYEILEEPTVEFLNDTANIAGLKCQKARLLFSDSNKNHDIYYTREIKADIANKNTAYEAIPGILMEFQMEMGNLTMLFKAKKLELREIDKEEFLIGTGYKNIPRDKMVKIINQLLE